MEVEIKLPVRDAEEAARRLEEGGAVLHRTRELEDNRLFDLPDRSLTRSGRLLRVRQAEGRVTVSAKAPSNAAVAEPLYKVRQEAEIVVDDAESFVSVLRVAGFEPLWRYQKYRRTYRWDGAEVVVDETPAGTFLEVEGSPDAIERITRRLGDAVGPRTTGTYRDLWVATCAQRGEEAGDMLFEPGAGTRP